MDTDSFIFYVNGWYSQRYCRRYWKTILTSNCQVDRPLPMGKNNKVIGILKDELGGQIMKKLSDYNQKLTAIQKTTTMKVKKQKGQKSVS